MIDRSFEPPSAWRDWLAEQKACALAQSRRAARLPGTQAPLPGQRGVSPQPRCAFHGGRQDQLAQDPRPRPELPGPGRQGAGARPRRGRAGTEAAEELFPKLHLVIDRAEDFDFDRLPGDLRSRRTTPAAGSSSCARGAGRPRLGAPRLPPLAAAHLRAAEARMGLPKHPAPHPRRGAAARAGRKASRGYQGPHVRRRLPPLHGRDRPRRGKAAGVPLHAGLAALRPRQRAAARDGKLAPERPRPVRLDAIARSPSGSARGSTTFASISSTSASASP